MSEFEKTTQEWIKKIIGEVLEDAKNKASYKNIDFGCYYSETSSTYRLEVWKLYDPTRKMSRTFKVSELSRCVNARLFIETQYTELASVVLGVVPPDAEEKIDEYTDEVMRMTTRASNMFLTKLIKSFQHYDTNGKDFMVVEDVNGVNHTVNNNEELKQLQYSLMYNGGSSPGIENGSTKEVHDKQPISDEKVPSILVKEDLGEIEQRVLADMLSKDNWKHRSKGMVCSTCMWYVEKISVQYELGRCRRHAPTLGGWPVMFATDWCGDHKLDETKNGE